MSDDQLQLADWLLVVAHGYNMDDDLGLRVDLTHVDIK
jgi:hypothetical protein